MTIKSASGLGQISAELLHELLSEVTQVAPWPQPDRSEARDAVRETAMPFSKGNRDHMTSWRVGIKDGLWKAYNIMEKYVKVKE